MARQQISVTAWSRAHPGVLYSLLCTGATWPTWSPIGSFELERPGPDGGEGIGAVRLFRTGLVRSHEEIGSLEQDRPFGYALLQGMPLRDYRAAVELSEDRGGTTVRWSASFSAAIPGTGRFYRWFLGRFIKRCALGLAAFAASPSAAGLGEPT
ncbi:MAG TPA: SRPBCC family protein [Acidimicrobiales bacterium]|nr:SRPBCC family protein [Acidimicrobiales bacterium]